MLSREPGAPPIKLVQLTDLHASEVVSLDYLRATVATALAEKPDVICLTGDFVTGRFDRLDELTDVLAPLAKAAPTFATLGNHDGGMWARACHAGFTDCNPVSQTLTDAGIQLLENASETISLHGRSWRFAGLSDMWSGGFNPDRCLSHTPNNAPTVVLSHNPDTKDSLRDRSWDLLLCGHTHGGQVRVPLWGAPYAPVRDKRFLAGLYPWEQRWLHVSTGVGNLHGGRFNCRPEINVLTLA
jgi:predicted MPP superfamily phosphohydrolase